MFDMINSKWDLPTSMSELESLGLETPRLNELNDSYEVENLVDNLKQMLFQDYKSTMCSRTDKSLDARLKRVESIVIGARK